MFDIGFSELMVIGVVALVVIGPERLPRVARTAGHLMGRAQRYVNNVKSDIRREIELDDLRKFKQGIDDAASELNASFKETQDSLNQASQSLQAQFDDTASEVKTAFEPVLPLAEPPGADPAEAAFEPALPLAEPPDADPAEAAFEPVLPLAEPPLDEDGAGAAEAASAETAAAQTGPAPAESGPAAPAPGETAAQPPAAPPAAGAATDKPA
jgi:sec-independent protein translocase protein TatB